MCSKIAWQRNVIELVLSIAKRKQILYTSNRRENMHCDASEKIIGNHTEQEDEMKKLIRGALAVFLSVAMLVTPSTVSNAVGGDAHLLKRF